MRVVAGEGPPPRLVLALVQALPDDSLTHALMQGGWENFGWGHSRHLMASIYDALNQNTIATGSWKKGKTPKLPLWPRPGSKKKAAKRKGPISLSALHAALDPDRKDPQHV